MRVLRHLGVDLDFPKAQTCCGQAAFNAGFRSEACRAARHFLETFADAEAVICPSGSCAAMVRDHFPELVEGDPQFAEDPGARLRMQSLASRTWELSQYLTEVLEIDRDQLALAAGGASATRTEPPAAEGSTITWHDSCHSLRSLGVRDGPRELLRACGGPELRELPDADVCCGFGGLFAVKFDAISAAMLGDKLDAIEGTEADRVGATDCSCLMHIEGGLRRRGARQRTVHLAELLAEGLGLMEHSSDVRPERGTST